MVVIAAIVYVIIRVAITMLEFILSEETIIVLITLVEKNALFLFAIVSEVIISIKFLLVHSLIISKQELMENLICLFITLI